MDRIERRLIALISAQRDVSSNFTLSRLVEWNYDMYESKMTQAADRRDALRQQIAEEWRAKDAALEAVAKWATTDIVSEEGTIGYFAETIMPMVDDALARAKEESDE